VILLFSIPTEGFCEAEVIVGRGMRCAIKCQCSYQGRYEVGGHKFCKVHAQKALEKINGGTSEESVSGSSPVSGNDSRSLGAD
jgi:hypothetical protein